MTILLYLSLWLFLILLNLCIVITIFWLLGFVINEVQVWRRKRRERRL